jgi:Uridylate kinase
MGALKYQRILLKLSGESLMGQQKFGITAEMLQHYAKTK